MVAEAGMERHLSWWAESPTPLLTGQAQRPTVEGVSVRASASKKRPARVNPGGALKWRRRESTMLLPRGLFIPRFCRFVSRQFGVHFHPRPERPVGCRRLLGRFLLAACSGCWQTRSLPTLYKEPPLSGPSRYSHRRVHRFSPVLSPMLSMSDGLTLSTRVRNHAALASTCVAPGLRVRLRPGSPPSAVTVGELRDYLSSPAPTPHGGSGLARTT